MNTIERVSALVGAGVVVFGIGVGWNSLNNRIDRVDEKIGAIQETLGSTACTAILTRQIEAIEKGRSEAREALEGLSEQYACVPRGNAWVPADDALANLTVDMGSNEMMTSDTTLANELNAVDVLLNEED